jgi:hypothetical protein
MSRKGIKMELKKRTEAQIRAQKNWDAKNRERSNYLKTRSTTKSFIRNRATREDLEDLLQLIYDKLQDL